MSLRRFWWIATVAAAACVPYPGGVPYEPPATTIVAGPFRALDPGANQLESLHFEIRAYGSQTCQSVADTAEANYNRIMVDTGLYSFKPKGLYKIVIYGSREEYLRKTSQPEWSGGVTVGNAIYSYLGPHLAGTLAHEMTHLIFYEFMVRERPDTRWINEGLAEYEEAAALGLTPRRYPDRQGALVREPLPLDHMLRSAPATERDRPVSDWYAQAQSMVRFMIEKGGRMGFSQFLTALRDDKPMGRAMGDAFPGSWSDLQSFERSWRASVQ